MKVTVITSSPRKSGITSFLADEFIRGAKESAHKVFRFDAAFEVIAPCDACDHCGMGSSKCLQSDSMEKLNPELIAADCIVFVTPLYYLGMSSQLKTVIDRFYANNTMLAGDRKKALLIASGLDHRAMQPLTDHYKNIVRYLKWHNSGMLLASGCATRNDIEKTDYPVQAYHLGKRL